VALPIAAGTYGIDINHSQLGFAVRHLGISVIRGTFERFAGSLTVGADLAGTVVAMEAEMDSVNTGNGYRDQQMHGPTWFDTDNHPVMSFRSTSIVDAPGGYAMTGDLTVKGITLPVTFNAVYNGSNTFPIDQSTRFGFEASGSISRSAYGVSADAPIVSDEVKLTLDAQFFMPATGA